MSYAKKFVDWLYANHEISLNHIPLDEAPDFSYCLALLFKLASGDGDSGPEEHAQILEFVKPESRLRMQEALKLLNDSQQKAQRMELGELLNFVDEALTLEQKKELLEMLYLVSRADMKKDPAEQNIINQFVRTCKISDDDHSDAYANALERRKLSAEKPQK